MEAKSKLARNKLVAITRKPKPFPYKMGNASLSHLWTKNTVTLDGFEGAPRYVIQSAPELRAEVDSFPFASSSKESFDDLVRAWRISNKMLSQKNTILADLTESGSTDLAKISFLNDEIEQVTKFSTGIQSIRFTDQPLPTTARQEIESSALASDPNSLDEVFELL